MFTLLNRKNRFWGRLRPGMTMQVFSDRSETFATLLERGRGWLVVRPEAFPLNSGSVTVRIPIECSLLIVTARVVGRAEGRLSAYVLDRFQLLQTEERRCDTRLPEPVSVRVNGPEPGQSRTLAALNISAHGLLLGWPDQPDAVLGERLQVSILLDGMEEICAAGEVIRVEDCKTALRFFDLGEPERHMVDGYVFRRQYERGLTELA